MKQVLPFIFVQVIFGTGSYSADNETTSQEPNPEQSQTDQTETEYE